jgi:hypothetical protein
VLSESLRQPVALGHRHVPPSRLSYQLTGGTGPM